MVEDNFLSAHGINRSDFMKLCAGMAATLGLSQGESVNVLLTGSQFLDASSQDSFQIFTAHA
ncbi:hypothetical protein ACW5WG_21335, partial [Aeromonas salmonicida]